jgi:glycosyltransferase involved in cell wall biosynthesis
MGEGRRSGAAERIPPPPAQMDKPMDSGLNILIVSTGDIAEPVSGSSLRVHHLSRQLGELGHRVEVLSLVVRNHPLRRAELGPRCSVRVMHSPWLDLGALADRIRLVPATELPVWLTPLRRSLRRKTRGGNFDVIQFEAPWFYRLYDAVRAAGGPEGPRIIYAAHNIESQWWAERLERYPMADRWRRRLERHEINAARAADGVTACSEADRDWIVARAGVDPDRIVVIPNGFDPHRLKQPTPDERAELRRRLGFEPAEKIALFVGSNHGPNRRAVEAIIQTIAPATADQPIRYVIVGAVGEAFGQASGPQITITGKVDDVAPYMQGADVGLNPTQEGSGSNVKLAEYCGVGLPVVTTEFGLRGYESLRPWLEVRPLEEFAHSILSSRWPGEIPHEPLLAFSWEDGARRLARFYEHLA